jgi:4-hydroxybenzoate polyprenyltransferase
LPLISACDQEPVLTYLLGSIGARRSGTALDYHWGELVVALTHSIGVLLAGYLLQGGRTADAWPWMVSAPILLSILPSIILSSFPGRAADAKAGKRTLTVIYGDRRAAQFAIVATLLTCLIAAVQWSAVAPAMAHLVAITGCALHGLLLSRVIMEVPRTRACRIDGTMFAALCFIAWPVLVPLAQLAY